MPTNDERREAARKLRDIGYLGNFDDVVKAIGFPNDMTWRMDEFNARLADLIDPGEDHPSNTEETVDRDALLALADDIDKQTDGSMFDAWLEDGHYIARRIREAVGA